MTKRLMLIMVTAAAIAFSACSEDDPSSPGGGNPSGPLLVSYTFTGDATDGSGRGNHGTLVGGATANGTLAIGMNDTDALEMPYTVLNGIGDFTIASWMKINTPHDCCHQLISGAQAPNDDNEFSIWYHTVTQRWLMTINGTMNSLGDDSRIEDGQWHDVAITRTGTSAMFYLDGDPFGGVINTTADKPIISSGGLFLGQDQDEVGGGFDANNSLNGEMDNFVMYNIALVDTAIKDLYDAPR